MIVIIGILAVASFFLFTDSSLKAKKTVAEANYKKIVNFIKMESAICDADGSNKIFGNNILISEVIYTLKKIPLWDN